MPFSVTYMCPRGDNERINFERWEVILLQAWIVERQNCALIITA